ncbi:MAG: DUF167 domain-containing protein [Candidatus Micrarchaeota archaeon]
MIVEVSVVPNSKKFSILVKNKRVKVALKNKPENNRANIELVAGLSNLMGKEVKLISGHKSKNKKLSINITESEWLNFLKTFC